MMNKMTPRVSVLVPVYNVKEYLRQCLDSLVSQTLQEIEIICVNDGSTDGSLEILKEYARKDARIVIVDKENGGLPSARNAGLDAAHGEYVGFIDADDFADIRMFECMYAEAKKKKADIVVCGANCLPEDAPPWLEKALSPLSIFYNGQCMDALLNERGARPFLWRDLVRRELIERNHLRLDESVIVGEDQAFQFKIFPLAKRIAFLSDKLYNYRWCRVGSIMNMQVKAVDIRLREHIKMVKSVARSWHELGLFETYAEYFFKWSIDLIYEDIVKVSACNKAEFAGEFCGTLIDNGYFLHMSELPLLQRSRFDFMYKQRGFAFAPPRLSVIIAVREDDGEQLSDCLRSVFRQNEEAIEAIVCINEKDAESIAAAREYLFKDPRVCVCLSEAEWSLDKMYNNAVLSAKGRYAAFFDEQSRFADKNAAKNALDLLDSDISAGYAGFAGRGDCLNTDFKQFVYRTDRIKERRILFRDGSAWTGKMFLTRYFLKNGYPLQTESPLCRSAGERVRALSAEEWKKVLSAAVWLLRMGKYFGLETLQKRITRSLDAEEFARPFAEETFCFPPNGSAEQNNMAEIFRLLLKANELALKEETQNALIAPLSKFIGMRQRFLSAL